MNVFAIPRFAVSGKIYWVLSDHTGGFQKVEEDTDGTFAFIHEASQIKYEYYNNCNLTEIGDPFAEQPYAVAVQQGSHLQVLNFFTSSGVLLLTEIFVSGGNQQSYPGTAEG